MAGAAGFKNPLNFGQQEPGRYFKLVDESVKNTCSLQDIDWLFLNVLVSKHCKNETLHSLQYDYSLPEFLKLKEYVEIMDAYESAINKDEENKAKQPKK